MDSFPKSSSVPSNTSSFMVSPRNVGAKRSRSPRSKSGPSSSPPTDELLDSPPSSSNHSTTFEKLKSLSPRSLKDKATSTFNDNSKDPIPSSPPSEDNTNSFSLTEPSPTRLTKFKRFQSEYQMSRPTPQSNDSVSPPTNVNTTSNTSTPNIGTPSPKNLKRSLAKLVPGGTRKPSIEITSNFVKRPIHFDENTETVQSGAEEPVLQKPVIKMMPEMPPELYSDARSDPTGLSPPAIVRGTRKRGATSTAVRPPPHAVKRNADEEEPQIEYPVNNSDEDKTSKVDQDTQGEGYGRMIERDYSVQLSRPIKEMYVLLPAGLLTSGLPKSPVVEPVHDQKTLPLPPIPEIKAEIKDELLNQGVPKTVKKESKKKKKKLKKRSNSNVRRQKIAVKAPDQNVAPLTFDGTTATIDSDDSDDGATDFVLVHHRSDTNPPIPTTTSVPPNFYEDTISKTSALKTNTKSTPEINSSDPSSVKCTDVSHLISVRPQVTTESSYSSTVLSGDLVEVSQPDAFIAMEYPPGTPKQMEVYIWLDRLNLADVCWPVFVRERFDDMDTLLEIDCEADLEEIGIKQKGVKKKLLKAFKAEREKRRLSPRKTNSGTLRQRTLSRLNKLSERVSRSPSNQSGDLQNILASGAAVGEPENFRSAVGNERNNDATADQLARLVTDRK